MFWPGEEKMAALLRLQVQTAKMYGLNPTGRSILVFLKFVGERQFHDPPLQHQALAISIVMRWKNLLTWSEQE